MVNDNFDNYDEDHDGHLNEEEFLRFSKVSLLESVKDYCWFVF